MKGKLAKWEIGPCMLLPEVLGRHNFLEGVDFNEYSMMSGYTFYHGSFAKVKRLARYSPLFSIRKRVKIGDLGLFTSS